MPSSFGRIGRKAGRRSLKDYVLWPLLAGPSSSPVLLGERRREHDPQPVVVRDHLLRPLPRRRARVRREAQIEDETRGRLVSCASSSAPATSTGGPLFHVLTGNLSHQIEHHLFPDMPSNRYPESRRGSRRSARGTGCPTTRGSLARQFGTTTRKIWRYALPGGKDTVSKAPALRAA